MPDERGTIAIRRRPSPATVAGCGLYSKELRAGAGNGSRHIGALLAAVDGCSGDRRVRAAVGVVVCVQDPKMDEPWCLVASEATVRRGS